MKTDREIFQEAFAKVRNPETWCQVDMYTDADGVPCASWLGVKFCSIGAIARACGNTRLVEPEIALESPVYKALKSALPQESLSRFNDTRTHAEVVELWERVGRKHGWLEEVEV